MISPLMPEDEDRPMCTAATGEGRGRSPVSAQLWQGTGFSVRLILAGTASTRAIWDAQARPRPVLRPCELRVKLGAQREVIMTGLDRVAVAWS